MNAKTFRKKPVKIEASQWHMIGDHQRVDAYGQLHSTDQTRVSLSCCPRSPEDHGWIKTLEGGHIVCPGDWIITGVAGEHYPCKPDIFAATYEEVS